MYTFTEENYLKTIYMAAQKTGELQVSTNELAEVFATKPASVTEMLKKLADKQLVDYTKYQGVQLKPLGQQVALKVIRKHRLWEFFLFEKLGFGWDAVHHIAEQLEHIQSEELVEKLDGFLGFPKYDPHGDPIPDAQGNLPKMGYLKLAEAKLGSTLVLCGVGNHTSSFLQLISKLNIQLGSPIEIVDCNEFDKSMTIVVNQSTSVNISHEVAINLWVQ